MLRRPPDTPNLGEGGLTQAESIPLVAETPSKAKCFNHGGMMPLMFNLVNIMIRFVITASSKRYSQDRTNRLTALTP
ncbi:hypothetical protein [Inhella inkyongensis]|uniref:hypothetical protein n=1 Tax=Inhella inkyongensis TaxID=392593 RepID=UPI001585DDF4|nr:hypothetical protein [Inhella inkyongensis]